ncbi:hypothetical protein [Dietzia alimentaria]|uniref:hypothetical protein n=1 Tax=Dietzia alimentaria TaxID=665550 RepID=UPI000299E124|nr:hypothetical protein [Dietzia alimentaria]
MSDTDESPEQLGIDLYRSQLDMREAELIKVVRDLCPGKLKHRPVQHRDARPPWCRHCGRSWRGEKVKEVEK